jgi:hypothetical protein
LRDTYNIDFPTGTALLNYLRTAGILTRVDRWKFAHDTFEEFFCASYLARIALAEKRFPDLALWHARPEEFVEVFNFLREFVDSDRRTLIAKQDLPVLWRRAILATSKTTTAPPFLNSERISRRIDGEHDLLLCDLATATNR